MKPKAKRHRKSALRILEQAVHLLRQAPAELLALYYIGALPFILGLFYFWGDLSRGADAESYAASAAFGMALLFIWMKYWQALFAARIYAYLGRHEIEMPFSRRRIAFNVASQTLLHAVGVFVLPLALCLTIPFGWCFAFYQNVTVLSHNPFPNVRALSRQAWRQAQLWSSENHRLIGVLLLFGLVVFVNLAAAVYMAPQLAKSVLGYESVFTMSNALLLNTTFWIVIAGLTYLCIDPLIKTAYALRCFYGLAVATGDDILVELHDVVSQQQTAPEN